MPNQITALYIGHLILCFFALFVTFNFYSRVFGKYVKSLNNIWGGFIFFLALNELIAIPFLLLNLPFKLFLVSFVLVNLAVIALGIKKASLKEFSKKHLKLPKSPYFIISIILLFTIFGLTLTHSYYSADDSFYVNLVEQNKTESNLYATDPTTGNERFEFPSAYQFQGWELIQSALSVVFRLSTLEMVYGLIPLVITTVAYFSYKDIFGHFLSRNNKYIALSMLLIMFIFGAYSQRAQGAFLITRPWQGKSIIAAITIPILIMLLYKFYLNLGKRNNWQILTAIAVLNIATISLNPTSIFFSFGATAVFGLMAIIKARRLKPALQLTIALLPFLPMIAYKLFFTETSEGSNLKIRSYSEYTWGFIGYPGYFAVWAVGLVVFAKTRLMQKTKELNYIYPIVLFLTVLNPLLHPLISGHVTSTAYWRLFWLLPMYITVPLIGAQAVIYLQKVIKNHTEAAKIGIAICVILFFGLAGKFVFNNQRYLDVGSPSTVSEVNTSRSKLPKGVFEANSFMLSQPEGTILAARGPSVYLHSMTSKHEIIAPRALNVRVYYNKEDEQYKFLMSLIALMNQREVNAFPIERFHQVIRRIGVTYIIYENQNVYLQQYVEKFQPNQLYKNDQYTIMQTVY